MKLVQYSLEYWLVLAAECRAVADMMSHSTTKQTMLRLAMSYERLAQHAMEQVEVIAGDRPTREEAEAAGRRAELKPAWPYK